MPDAPTIVAGARAIVTQLRALPTLSAATDAQRATLATLKDDCDAVVDVGAAVAEGLVHLSAALGRILDGITVPSGDWTLAWDSNFAGAGFPIATPGIAGVMRGSDASYGLSAAAGWTPRNRFAIAEPRGSFETNRWAYQPDPNYDWGVAYSPFAIVDAKLRIRAQPTPAGLVGQIPNRVNQVAPNGYVTTDTGVAYPWVTGQAISLGYVEFGGDFKVESRSWHQKGKASFPAFWLLQTTFVERLNEIDVFEAHGLQFAKSSAALHGAQEFFDFVDRGVGDLSTGYHVWTFTKEGMVATWFLDGVQVAQTTLTAAILDAGHWYMILSNAMLDWDDQWLDGAGEAGGGAPNTARATYPTQNPSDLLVDYVRLYSKPTTRLSGRAFPLGGSTAWLPASLAGTPPAVVLDPPNDRWFAFAANQRQKTLAFPRTALNSGDPGNQLVGPALGAAMARRGVWAIKTTVPSTSPSDLDSLLSVGDHWAYIVINSAKVQAGIGGTEPFINHGLSPGDPITILLYVGADVGSKLVISGFEVSATGSYPSEYLGEHARLGVGTFGNEHPATRPILLAAWYDLDTYPGDGAMLTLLAAL